MSNDTNDWRELREFAGVDLTQSFVLSWEYAAEVLMIDIDLCLNSDHPFYEKPRPAERVCIRPAMLEFPYCTSLSSAGPDVVSADPEQVAAALGHGRIDDLRRTGDGRYEITGAFGSARIASERPLLRLKGSVA